MRRAALLLMLATILGCPDERPRAPGSRADASLSDAKTSTDASDGDAAVRVDAAVMDSGAKDAASHDATVIDAGIKDAEATDAEAPEAGPTDAGIPDTGPPDTGFMDASAPDAAPVDAGPPAVTCTEPGLQTRTITDSASSGTPDTYFFDVNPGDPFCAEIRGGGNGTWGVTVSNGTSAGVYCSNITPCRIRIPAGTPTVLVTAQTSDIGGYTLTVRLIPR